jgi:signal transduction histidine kinase
VAQEPSTFSPDRWLVFEVTDTGCGIAKEGLHALFNDYVQARPASAELQALFSAY